MANRSKSLVSELKMGLVIATSLFVASPANASELNVADKVGTSFLRVDAAEGTTFDLVVSFKNSSLNLPAGSTLSLVSDGGNKKDIPLNANAVRDGVRVSNVSLGDYVVSANPELLEIKSISVTENVASASLENEDSEISNTTYAVGAAAIAGGVIAVSAGSDSLDVFGGSDSRASSARSGSGTSGSVTSAGSTGSASAPQVSALLPTSQFDPNYPTNVPVLVGTPAVFPTPRGAPPTQNLGSGLQTNPGGPTPTPTATIVPPTVAPVPPVTSPLTPS